MIAGRDQSDIQCPSRVLVSNGHRVFISDASSSLKFTGVHLTIRIEAVRHCFQIHPQKFYTNMVHKYVIVLNF